MTIALDEFFELSIGDAEVLTVDFSGRLVAPETLTGSPVVTQESGAAGLVIDSIKINTVDPIPVEGECREIPVSNAVQFRVSGGTGMYAVKVSTATNGSPVRTFERLVRFQFK